MPCNCGFQPNPAMPRLYLPFTQLANHRQTCLQRPSHSSQHIPITLANWQRYLPQQLPHPFPLPGSDTSLYNLAPTSCPLQRPPLPPGAQAPDSLPSLAQAPSLPGLQDVSGHQRFPLPAPPPLPQCQPFPSSVILTQVTDPDSKSTSKESGVVAQPHQSQLPGQDGHVLLRSELHSETLCADELTGPRWQKHAFNPGNCGGQS